MEQSCFSGQLSGVLPLHPPGVSGFSWGLTLCLALSPASVHAQVMGDWLARYPSHPGREDVLSAPWWGGGGVILQAGAFRAPLAQNEWHVDEASSVILGGCPSVVRMVSVASEKPCQECALPRVLHPRGPFWLLPSPAKLFLDHVSKSHPSTMKNMLRKEARKAKTR